MTTQKIKLELERYPHWERPYNRFFYKVIYKNGTKKVFCHMDIAVENYERDDGQRIYITTKHLHPTSILWKDKDLKVRTK